MESAFSLFDVTMKRSFVQSVNNTVALARALYHEGTFKAVMYDARDTLHIDRVQASDAFTVPKRFRIPYRLTPAAEGRMNEKMHSYFEDGRDPDEHLVLPASIMVEIEALDQIHHTGCIIFEALPKNLKIHNYYSLLDPAREAEFKQRLYNLLQAVGDITGVGIGGFMKMPYKDSRFFQHLDHAAEHFYPRQPVPRS
jgi:non-specific serine/threonine protein kinase